jgi:hypothetical protein
LEAPRAHGPGNQLAHGTCRFRRNGGIETARDLRDGWDEPFRRNRGMDSQVRALLWRRPERFVCGWRRRFFEAGMPHICNHADNVVPAVAHLELLTDHWFAGKEGPHKASADHSLG